MDLLAFMLFALMAVATNAGKCGKGNGRVTMKHAVSLASPDFKTKSSCRWRYRTAKGLHLQLTFSEFSIDSCCSSFTIFDAAKSSFSWEKTKIIATPTGVRNGPYVLTIPTFVAGIQYESQPGKSSFAMTMKPVVPQDGNCGFQTKAIDRVRTIRTPGFPRPGYVNNLACRWTIRAQEGKLIEFKVLRLYTDSEDDYLEIRYDGNVKRHWGRLRDEVRYLSAGNEMDLYFHTNEVNTDRGFVAKYVAITPNKTDVFEPTGGNVCWKQTVITSAAIGRQVVEGPTNITCPKGTQCGSTFLSGVSRRMRAKVVTESSGCLPPSGCDLNSCDAMPNNDPDISLTECRTSCCDGDLCNTQFIESAKPAKIIKCYDMLITKSAFGGPPNKKVPKTCDPNSQCLRFEADSVAKTLVGDVKVAVVYGNCMPKAPCSSMDCSSLPINQPGITFDACNISCCDDDLCNDGEPEEDEDDDNRENLRPSPPVSASITCYNSMLMKGVVTGVMLDTSKEESCGPGQICMSLAAKASMGPVEMDILQTSCLPPSACGPSYCRAFTSSPVLPSGMSITDCDVSCCRTNLCNARPSG